MRPPARGRLPEGLEAIAVDDVRHALELLIPATDGGTSEG